MGSTPPPPGLKLYLFNLFSFISFGQDFLPISTFDQNHTHSKYTLSYSEPQDLAELVACKLTESMLNDSVSRIDKFSHDPDIMQVHQLDVSPYLTRFINNAILL